MKAMDKAIINTKESIKKCEESVVYNDNAIKKFIAEFDVSEPKLVKARVIRSRAEDLYKAVSKLYTLEKQLEMLEGLVEEENSMK